MRLRITNIRPVVDFIPPRPGLDTLYAPSIDSSTGNLYCMGGHVDAPQPSDPTHIDHFADKIYMATPFEGEHGPQWGNPEVVIDKYTFPWMRPRPWNPNKDAAAVGVRPESAIGSVGGPVVMNGGDAMLFAASVSDPNVCTGEHGNPTPHGSCSTPWSYFSLFSVTRGDNRGYFWSLVNWERGLERGTGNYATEFSMLRYEPPQEEITGHQDSEYKGITAVTSMIPDDDLFGVGYHVFMLTFWSSKGEREVWVRVPVVVKRSESEDSWEIRDRDNTWHSLVDGQLPSWCNNDLWRGRVIPYGPANQLVRTDVFPGYKYALISQWSWELPEDGSVRMNGAIAVMCSNDLWEWTEPVVVECEEHPLFKHSGDVVFNPILVDGRADDGRGSVYDTAAAAQPYLLWSTNDRDLDGYGDYKGSPYKGMRIMRGDLEVIV